MNQRYKEEEEKRHVAFLTKFSEILFTLICVGRLGPLQGISSLSAIGAKRPTRPIRTCEISLERSKCSGIEFPTTDRTGEKGGDASHAGSFSCRGKIVHHHHEEASDQHTLGVKV